ncbi:MAG: peptide chain release factor 1 [Rickettsiales bacterium]|jgi:peptide chain release factor 1|nr:peptide chain release factor 1 [Rickettsiales bacterium]
MAFMDKLNELKVKHQALAQRLLDGISDNRELAKVSKEYSDLGDIVEIIDRYQDALKNFDEAKKLLSDPEMKDLAQDEYDELKEKIPALEKELQIALLPKDVDDDKNAILEIRAGTGGEEASLFAGDLFRMYQGYAGIKGWGFEVLDESATDLKGFKEVSVLVSGKGAYSRLKFESGTHRVQRVPETEASGRVHTSAATVAVMPEVSEIDVDINPADLRIDTYRASGAGGQHVNKTDSAIRITHIPTGVVVQCQDERSQHKNKDRAMKMLMAKLYDAQKETQEKERAKDRKSQVGSGDRSERIRTYNFPQSRVSDHRINLTLYKLATVLTGEDLDEIVGALITAHQLELLQAL